MVKHLLVSLCVLALISGCQFVSPGIQGSGIEVSELRSVEPFERVDLDGTSDVFISFGETQSVTVTTDDNLIQLVRTVVVGNQLRISTSGSYSTSLGIQIDIVVPRLIACELNGTGDIDISGYAGEELELSTNGVGDITCGGTVGIVHATTDGIGDIQLAELVAREAYAITDGIGDIVVNATEKVDARINGIGSITIIGDPKNVQTEVDGMGDIIRN